MGHVKVYQYTPKDLEQLDKDVKDWFKRNTNNYQDSIHYINVTTLKNKAQEIEFGTVTREQFEESYKERKDE